MLLQLGSEAKTNSWAVESSTDLRQWESLGDMVAHHAPAAFPEPQSITESRRYYRAVLHQETTQTTLNRNRMQWMKMAPAAYHFTFQWQCFCLPEYTAPVVVSVRDTRIVSVRRQDDGLELDESAFSRYPTIDGLFDFLQAGLNSQPSSLSALFDPCLGFPKRAWVDYSDAVIDEERGFLIEQFEVTSPTVQITDLAPARIQLDPFHLGFARIEGENLFLGVSYSGGCAIHDFELFMSPSVFMESYPVQANLYLRHDGHGDPCLAWLSQDLAFGLRPLLELHESFYGSPAPIILNVYDYFHDTPQRRFTVRYIPGSLAPARVPSSRFLESLLPAEAKASGP